jgi:hypothetical protein
MLQRFFSNARRIPFARAHSPVMGTLVVWWNTKSRRGRFHLAQGAQSDASSNHFMSFREDGDVEPLYFGRPILWPSIDATNGKPLLSVIALGLLFFLFFLLWRPIHS